MRRRVTAGMHNRRLVEAIHRYRLADRHEWIRQLLRMAEMGELSDDMAEMYMYAIRPAIDEQERRFNGLPRVPTLEELYPAGVPPLVLGHLEEKEEIPLALPLEGAFHCVYVGTTGAGKTVAMRRLVLGIEEFNRGCDKPVCLIILDYKGHDYADLPGLLGDHWRHYDVHGALRMGLQNPVGVPVPIWINHLASVFCARAGLIASWATLANELRWLVTAMNPRPTDQLLFPDFQLLLDVARALPDRAFAEKVQYTESLIHYLEGVKQASDLFRTFNGLDLERDLISQGLSAVISLPHLSPPWLNQFIADLFVLQLLLGRIFRSHRVDAPEVILLLDEADNIVSRDNERFFATGMPPVVQGLRQFREFGVGVCLGVGALGPISQHVLNSVSHLFVLRMPHDDCVIAAKRNLGLPPGSEGIIRALESGECVVRLGGVWPHAFLARIDSVPPCRDVQPQFDANPHVPAQRLDEMPHLVEAVEQLADEVKRGRRRRGKYRYARLRRESRQLLYQVSLHPYWPVVRLYELTDRPAPAVQKAVRTELIDGEYADIVDTRIGSRTVSLIELKEAAWSLLGKPAMPLQGRGSLEHRTFANWLRLVGTKRGFAAFVEFVVAPPSTHAVDCAWCLSPNVHEVFEVVVHSPDNLGDHLRAILVTAESPVTAVTIVAPKKTTLRTLRAKVEACADLAPFMDRVSFAPVEVFEKELWP